MKSRSKKIEELKAIKKKIPNLEMVVFTAFSKAGEKGLSVSQMTELKRTLKALNSEYLVAKKSLIDLALRGLNLQAGGDGINIFGLDGSIGLVLGQSASEAGKDSHYALAKKLYEFSKKNPSLRFFGALVNGSFIDTDKFMEIAKMPSREVLIGRLVGMLIYPIRGLAVALSEVAKIKN